MPACTLLGPLRLVSSRLAGGTPAPRLRVLYAGLSPLLATLRAAATSARSFLTTPHSNLAMRYLAPRRRRMQSSRALRTRSSARAAGLATHLVYATRARVALATRVPRSRSSSNHASTVPPSQCGTDASLPSQQCGPCVPAPPQRRPRAPPALVRIASKMSRIHPLWFHFPCLATP